MTSTGPADAPPALGVLPPNIQDGPYVLRSLLDNVPLSADDSHQDVKINCVEYLGKSPFTYLSLLPLDAKPASRQTTTYTSVPRHLNSFTSLVSLPTPPTAPATLCIYSPQGSLPPMLNRPRRAPAFNRSSFSPALARPASYATGQSPSTPSLS